MGTTIVPITCLGNRDTCKHVTIVRQDHFYCKGSLYSFEVYRRESFICDLIGREKKTHLKTT